MHLSQKLDQHLSVGPVDEIAVTRMLNDSIGRVAAESEELVRYRAISIATGAISRYIGQRRRQALTSGALIRAWHLSTLASIISEWTVERSMAPLDGNADMLRVNLLRFQLQGVAGFLRETREVLQMSNAMARVAGAGTQPVTVR